MKEAKEFLNNILNNNDVVVVACSGGPDSMCLLHVINSFALSKNIKVICAHVNHGLRKESVEEAEFVKKYCEDNNIIFEYMKINGYTNNHFSEEEGRSKRYTFFNEIVKKYSAKFLMTAHHGDDLIETILMRIVRGSNLKGYAGIYKVLKNDEYQIIRPLLSVNKEMIYDYLEYNKINYVFDESNNDEKYTRNRYRKQMLPFLKNEDKMVYKKFLKYSEELGAANEYIKNVVKEKYNNVVIDGIVDINKLLENDEYIQEKIIEYLIEDIQKEEIFNITDKQFQNLMKLIKSTNNCEINLADNFIARKSYNKLYIEKNKDILKYKYEFNGKLSILNKYKFETVEESNDKSNNIIRLDSSEVALPLIIRVKEQGDKINVKNMNGSKKVKDIFIDSKVDIKKRLEYPIVTDSKNNVIWIPGIKKSTFDKEINKKYDIIIKYTEE